VSGELEEGEETGRLGDEVVVGGKGEGLMAKSLDVGG